MDKAPLEREQSMAINALRYPANTIYVIRKAASACEMDQAA